jgi:hypothetical protein
VADTYNVAHNTTLTIDPPGVLGNDNFQGQVDVTAELIEGPASGLTLASSGYVQYTPVTDFVGTVTFRYRATSVIAGPGNIVTNSLIVGPPGPPPPPDVNCQETFGAWTPGQPPEGWSTCVANNGVSGPGTQFRDRTWTTTVAQSGNGLACTFTGTGVVGTQANEHQTQACDVPTIPVPPVAVDDTYTVPHNTTLPISAPGILANDDLKGQTDVTALVQSTNLFNGGLNVLPNGSFVFTPAAGFFGPATFTYKAVSAAAGLSNTATVTLNVNAPDDPPPPPDVNCVETPGLWGPGNPPEGWSECVAIGGSPVVALQPGTQYRDRTWTTAVARSGNGLACTYTGGGPVGTTAIEHQTQQCNAPDPPPPPPPPPGQIVGVQVIGRTCILTLSLPNVPPDSTPGWSVQFWRRIVGSANWTAHGTRDATAPFERAAAIEASPWEARAVWKRPGAVDVVTATRPVACGGIVLQP